MKQTGIIAQSLATTGPAMTETPRIRKPAVHLSLMQDYLVAANHGRPFTLEGLHAACRIRRSSKTTKVHRSFADRAEADFAVEKVRNQMIAAALEAPDKIVNNAINEAKIKRRLAGKLIRELLLNANDAVGLKQIGGKGLGFKTLLVATDTPRVHSGHLSFRFDRERSREAYDRAGIDTDGERFPAMSLPFGAAPDDEPEHVRRLMAEYDTVIVLPFRSERSRKVTLVEWERRVRDVNMVRKFPALRTVVWDRTDDTETSRRICLEEDAQNIRVFDEGQITSTRPIVLRNPRRSGPDGAAADAKKR